MRVRRRCAATTLAAFGVIVGLTLAFVVFAFDQISSIDPARRVVRVDEARYGLDAHMGNNATAITAGLVLAVCVLALGAGVGVIRRSAGARHAAIGLFGILGFVALAAALGGLTATPRSPNAWYGLLCGIANFVIVGLLLAPSTADDFDRVEHARQWVAQRSGRAG